MLRYTKSRSVLKIHFNFKDKSIYVSGYGVLDAKRVSSVALNGDVLNVRSHNASHTWASTVSLLQDNCMYELTLYICMYEIHMNVWFAGFCVGGR